MAGHPEPTLEELLREPIILTLMERDGYSADDIRQLARQATEKTRLGAGARSFAPSMRAAAARQNACLAACR